MTHKQAVFELFYSRYASNPDNFNSLLFRLFQKADSDNRMRLRLGFPELYEAWKEWSDSPTEKEFFAKYGFTRESLNTPQEFE